MKTMSKEIKRKQLMCWKNAVVLAAVCMMIFLMKNTVWAAQPEGIVGGLRQTGASETSVGIQYNALLDANAKYSIQVSTTKDSGYQEMATSVGSSASVSGLSAGSSYYVRVVPFYEQEGEAPEYGQPSATLSVATAPATAPNTIIQTGSTDNSISILWDPVAGASGYSVEYCLTNGVTSEKAKLMVGTNSATLTGLSKSKKYSVYVTPYKMSETGFVACDTSKVASKNNLAIGLADSSVPTGAVAGLMQTKASTDSVEIAFAAVNDISTQYAVFYSKDQNFGYTEAGVTAEGNYKLTGLEAGCHYYVYIIPFHQQWNSLNEEYDRIYGTASGVVDVVTVPNARPKMITQTAATGASISVMWDAVAGADGYRIDYYRAGSKTQKSCTVMTNSAKLSGLSKNKEYNIFVTPFCRSANGYEAYDENNYTCVYNVPVKPQKAQKASVNSFWRSIGKVNFSTKKIACADGYQYQLYTDYLDKNKKIATVNSTSYSSAEIKDNALKADAAFKVRVRAYITISGKKVYGAWSDWSYLSTPQKVTLSKENGKIAALWNKVKGADRYVIYVSTQKDYGFKKCVVTGKTSCNITVYGSKKLVKGTKYYAYVVPQKKVGKSYVSLKPNGTISEVKF